MSGWLLAVDRLGVVSEYLLTAGMAAVGLNITVKGFRAMGWRPVLAAVIVAVSVGATSLALTSLVTRWI
jgi:uncharacterized membrane protein YadS